MSPAKKIFLKALIVVISNVILALGIGLLRIITFGVDPFTGMFLSASYFFKYVLDIHFMTSGLIQLILNLVFFIVIIKYNRKQIGFGTVFNMVFVGFLCDGFEAGFLSILPHDLSLPLRLLFLIIAIILISMGVGLYGGIQMGTSPYDGFPFIINEQTKGRISITKARMAADITCALVGFLLVLPTRKLTTILGIATLILAFGLGPLTTFFRVYLGDKFLWKNLKN